MSDVPKTPLEFVHWLEAVSEPPVDSPHCVVMANPIGPFVSVVGPFSTALTAAEYAEKLNEQINSPAELCDGEFPPVSITVCPINPALPKDR